ncbi:MAG: HIT family protein [Planctomycetota bacterium]
MTDRPADFADTDCVFCKIVAGQIPCHKLLEDDHVLGFLDVGPVSPGHALLIPKGHYPALHDVPAETAAALGAALPKLASALREVGGFDHYNVLQNNGAPAGQAVFHVHFHLIPRRSGDSRGEGVGLRFDWPAQPLDHEAAAPLAEQVRAAIG